MSLADLKQYILNRLVFLAKKLSEHENDFRQRAEELIHLYVEMDKIEKK